MGKRIISILITLLMIVGLMPSKLNAEEVNLKVYEYDNYTIKYTITNEWKNNQNVSIIISNISNEPIENWMLAYDFCRKTTLTY